MKLRVISRTLFAWFIISACSLMADPSPSDQLAGFSEYYIADEGFSICIPEGWSSIELDRRRVEENFQLMVISDEPRATFEKKVANDLIDYSKSFVAYSSLITDAVVPADYAEVEVTRIQVGSDFDKLTYIDARLQEIKQAGTVVTMTQLTGFSGEEIHQLDLERTNQPNDYLVRSYLILADQYLFEIRATAQISSESGVEPEIFEIVAKSFRADGQFNLPKQTLITNGLVTATLPSQLVVYTSTRDGFSITLPETWVEVPLRNAHSISSVLGRFGALDVFGWPNTQPNYLDIEFTTIKQGLKLFWLDKNSKTPDVRLTEFWVAKRTSLPNETLASIEGGFFAQAKSEPEDITIISSERLIGRYGELLEVQLSVQDSMVSKTLAITSWHLQVGSLFYEMRFSSLESQATTYEFDLLKIIDSFTVTR